MAARFPTIKLIVLAILGFFALVLGSIVLTFQLQVLNEKNIRGLLGRNSNSNSNSKNSVGSFSTSNTKDNGGDKDSKTNDSTTASSATNKNNNIININEASKHTVKSSVPTGAFDIRLWNLYPAPEGGNYKTSGEAYWRQVQAFLRDWKDAAVYPPDLSDHHTYSTDWMVRKSSEYRSSQSQSSNNNNSTSSSTSGEDAYHFYPRLALERAANAGHPMAQHYLANAHSSGIWPVPAVGGGGGDEYTSSDNKSSASSLVEDLHIFDEWTPSSSSSHDKYSQQMNKAYLLWHMAAVGGNIESAMALAHRLDNQGDGVLMPSSEDDKTCEDVLPYYQAAADGIIDQLEVNENSRAKVLPPMDKHTLTQVHMHGGTSSQLDWNNKPDESKEALQFYHLKATTVPWSMKKKSNSNNENDKKKEKSKNSKKKAAAAEQDEGIDVSAAFTLAHMHHYGMRGVEQNLTKSLEYYQISGSHGHWESAGHACIFHLWGIGTDQNARQAMQFCKIGAPFGYEGCRQMRDKAQAAKKNKRADDSQIMECDENALNGLGLLHLLGIQGVLKVDVSMAEKYLTLAKELGSADAYYNLAMMWLGWKTHFKTAAELKENGFTPNVQNAETVLPIPGVSKKGKAASEKFVLYKHNVGDNLYYKGPIQQDVQNAIKMLGVAAKLGHVQAKHRLASIYAEGLDHTTSVIKFNFVKKDCKKAKEHFQWIVSNASPTLSNRLRRAYKEYIAGNHEVALRNYLAAAEIGSIVGQVNAAFLMERGVCLGLSAADCAKAAVRLWKAAAARGNVEACLRVGDFYYYGRLHGEKLHNGPFGWIQYFLLPEKYLPTLLREGGTELLTIVRNYMGHDKNSQVLESSSSSETTCEAEEDGTCRNDHGEQRTTSTTTTEHNNLDHEMEEDLHTAAHYYQLAGDKYQSARANFNLGFMHQWGLGLKQDFPMAKRHYDLALSRNYREAEIAVQIALMAMNTHEFIIRCKVLLEEWWYQLETTSTSSTTSPSSSTKESSFPSPTQSQSPGLNKKKTVEEVIMSHIFDQSSFILLVLVLIILIIQMMMSFIKARMRPQI